MNRKLCGGCLKVRDCSEFQKSCTRRIGVQSLCRACANVRKRERRLRREKGQKRLFADDISKAPGFNPGENFPALKGGALENSGDPAVGTVNLPSAPQEPADRKTLNKCHGRVRRAIGLGKLVRPERCTVCRRSRDEVGTLHAHHEDYRAPLSVVFLCRTCHKIVHGKKEKSNLTN